MTIVPNSYGTRRPYTITLGLQEGYGTTGKTHSFEEAQDLFLQWMTKRALIKLPFLTGTLSHGQVLYAWADKEGAHGAHEPAAVFSGEVSILYGGDLTDKEVEVILNDLTSFVGTSLGQTRVYVSYKEHTWVLQQEESKTPTGE